MKNKRMKTTSFIKVIIISCIAMALAITIVIYNMEISYERFDYSLYGTSHSCVATLESHGSEVWFMWDGHLEHITNGGSELVIELKATPVGGNTYVDFEYKCDIDGIHKGGSQKGPTGKVLVKSYTTHLVKSIKQDDYIEMWINGEYEKIHMIEDVW